MILLWLEAPARGESETAARASAEPELVRFTFKVAPTARQIESMPGLPAEWRLTPPIAAHFEEVLKAGQFSAEVAAALRKSFRKESGSGEGVIVPDDAMLALFRPAERLRWWAVLAAHSSNRSYRWPVAIPRARLDAMASQAEFAAAVARVRAWGISDGAHVLFADAFALGRTIPDPAARTNFLREVFAVDTYFAKVGTPDQSAARSQDESNYWQGRKRSRTVESILDSTRQVDDYERLDVAHLLPRLPRSLLHTFPPDLGVNEEPSVENAIAAVSFFRTAPGPRSELDGGFGPWLLAHCEQVRGARELGDIVVFEDATQKRWPFAMMYIADGVLFGRRPGLYGPWELLPEADVARLNPRLRGQTVTTYRIRDGGSAESQHTVEGPPPALPDVARLQPLAEGPWGRLHAYNVLLAPSTELLEEVPVPASQPEWTFAGVTREKALAVVDSLDAPVRVRRELAQLFIEATPDEKGRFTVHPSTALVFATPAAFRQSLFPYLVHGVEGTDYAQHVPIATDDAPAEWFRPGVLPEALRDTLLALTYRRGGGLALSDFGALWHAAGTSEERLAMLRVLYQSPVLVVLLERPRPSEVAGLVDYWRIHQQKSVGSLLDSFARDQNARHLDIIHLMPPLVRETMNVFMRAPVDAPTPSCYWTALNFAAERPDPRLLVTPRGPGNERKIVEQKLRADYVLVDKPAQLGDVILYQRRRDKEPLHVCSYIAGGVVYTKNGFGFSSPWCLMHLKAVDALYFQPETVDRLVYRMKD